MKTTVLLVAINSGLMIEGTPPPIALGVPYTYTLRAHGNAGKFAFTQTGALPSGIAFTDNGDGTATIHGTTTAAGGYPINVVLSAVGRGFPASVPYNFLLEVPPLSLQLVHGTVTRGIPVDGIFAVAHGGAGGYTFSSMTLPAGLTINSTTGVVTGSVTAPLNTYNVTVNVVDSVGNTGSATVPIVVRSRMYFIDPAPTDCADGLSYNFEFRVSMNWTGTLHVSVTDGALPPGLVMDSLGIVSGIPHGGFSVDGPFTYSFTVTATDSGLGESISIDTQIDNYGNLIYPV